MNRALLQLLEEHTPGILTTRQGIERQNIPYPDSIKMLKMRSVENIVEEGQWTRVHKGKYRGDVGLVVAVASWGAELLLVPRLNLLAMRSSTPNLALASSLKRKRTADVPQPALFDVPPSALFNPGEFNHEFPPESLANGHYTYMGLFFEHGLIRKRFDLHSIKSTPTAMPYRLFFLFDQSKHPLVLASTIPRPQEWVFEEHETIFICSSKKEGTITAMQMMHAEVELASGEGTISVPLHDLRKVFVAGDSVSIRGGALNGRTGLVVRVNGDIAYIVDKSLEGGMPHIHGSDSIQVFLIRYKLKYFLTCLQEFEVHVNLLRIAIAPYFPTPHPMSSTSYISKVNWVPWLDIPVTIIKAGPHKGHSAVVKNVLPGQTTSSNLRLEIQFLHIDPSSPFKIITVDYDDVVESM